MARLFPTNLVGAVSPEVAKLLHALRRVPGEDFLVWVQLPLFEGWRPALMVINAKRSCHLFTTCAHTEAEAEAILRHDLFAVTPSPVEPSSVAIEERTRLRSFIRSVFEKAGVEEDPIHVIQPVIACPNVSQGLLDEISKLGAITDCLLWGRETLRTSPLSSRIEEASQGAQDLPAELIDALRESFSPEINIPDHLVARAKKRPSRTVGSQLTSFLLDLNQEFLAKEDLMLSEGSEAAAREMRLRLVTGVAGSGKSLILLYRAMLQVRLQPEARILILTHNRPLSGELRDRFRRLCPGSKAEWATFFEWCAQFSGARWDLIKPWDRDTLICGLANQHPELSRLPKEFIAEELDWIREQGIEKREEYLLVSRVGRKRPLSDEQRNALFSLLVSYCAELRVRELDDWTGAAWAVCRKVERGTLNPPVYDSVFVDEAQFFAPTWLRLVRKAVRPETGQLFLAADPTQGFLKRRQSWVSSGLNVRGHSTRLLRCYRNTREILGFACAFYRHRLPEEEEEVNLPGADELGTLDQGEAPRLVLVDSPQGERARVANEIAAAVRSGANPEHFLVIQSESAMVAPFIQTLDHCCRRRMGRDLKDRDASAANGLVKVSSLNAATGLESPVVFLCGVDSLLEREGGLQLDPDSELIQDNTRPIYMGMTRASQKLLITYQSPATRRSLGSKLATAAHGSEGTVALSSRFSPITPTYPERYL